MSDLTAEQMSQALLDLVDDQLNVFNEARKITVYNTIPETTSIPKDDPNHWIQIPDVICVFVDMKGSTQLSASTHAKTTAGVYQLFTGTAVRMFHEFEAPYIDVRGDGVFALFNQGQEYRALAAAVSFKTFASVVFSPKVKAKTGIETDAHIGIDQRTVLAHRIGLRQHKGRTDRVNEVWAGKPVNMASKLASSAEAGQLVASDRYFEKITDEHARKSCDCGDGGVKVDLWEERSVSSEGLFDFDKAYVLKSQWCAIHGKEYCAAILALDE